MPTKSFARAKILGRNDTISIDNLSDDLPITEVITSIDDLPASGALGEQAFVEGSNRLYMWNGTGWYNVALINETPAWDSGGQPNATYDLSSDSPQSSTTVTLAASDPEGLPINYSYITGGSMDSIATVSQDSSVYPTPTHTTSAERFFASPSRWPSPPTYSAHTHAGPLSQVQPPRARGRVRRGEQAPSAGPH